MNASDTINVAIEFVSKQVDPGGGGTVTTVAQTGDFAIFLIIALALACALGFAIFKVSRIYNFGNANVEKNVNSKNAYRGGRFATKVLLIIALTVAFVACLGITTTKAIAANASNGLVVQPDKIQIPIDETTGQPDPASFKFINDSTDDYLFDTTFMSLTDEAKSLTSAEDWGINITGGNTTIYAGEPDGVTAYEIKNIQTLKPAQSLDSVLTFSKFDVDLAKKLIGMQVFSLTLNYNNQTVAPNPKVNTGLIYNREEQTGVEQLAGYTLEGTTIATNAGTYSVTAKLAEGYDIWEDGTIADKQITWTIEKSKIESINVQGTTKTVPYRTGTSHKFPDEGDVAYTLNATMAPGYVDIFDEDDVTISPAIQPIVQSEINTYPLGLDTDKYSWAYNNENVLFDPSDFVIQDAYLVITDDPIPVAKPTAKSNLVYTGEPLTGVEQTGDGYSLTGNVQTDVPLEGTDYEAIATLEADHIWDDGTRDVLHIHWTIAKAEGCFSEDPKPSSDLVYSSERQKLIKPGTVDYEANVYYMIEGETSYSTEIPEGILAKSYNVKAYIEESRNYEASEPVSLTATIEKAVVSSVTIQGAIGDADYIKDASYVFPDFEHGEEAYTISSWEVEKGPKNVFKKEQVRPLPGDGEAYPGKITIGKATPEDIGPHDFILPDKTQWSYLDTNVEVRQDAWNPIKGCFTLNESSIVSLEVNITSSKTEYLLIDETVEYTVNITNNTEEAISGAKITFGSQDYSVETIPAKGNQTVKINYTIVADDFLYYPNLVKKFIFKYNDFSKQVQHQTSLKNKIIDDPTLYNGFYDKTEHKFPTNEGYTFLGGYDTSFNAGYYYAVVMRNLGYEWNEWPYDYNVYTWEIKKINVNICFATPDETNTFTATYGDNWDVHAQSIVAKTTDVETLPDSVHDILGGDPDGWSNYAQWSKVGVYEAQVVLPSPANAWNINYNITKTDARLNIVEKDITITWPAEKEFKYTGEVINIEFTVNGSFSEHPATVSYSTFADLARTIPKPFKEIGSYYVSAHLGTDADSSNYKIIEGAQPLEVFEITETPAPTEKTPKAILTRDNTVFGIDKSLVFVYDNTQYTPDPLFIENVYDVTPTVYNPDGNSQNPSWAGCDPKVVKIDRSFKEFTEFPDTQKTPFTSMDLWFAGMENLKNIEGLENIYLGITTLNATFMKTKLDEYTFPESFFDGVSSTNSMFKDCSNVEEFDVSNWDYSSFENTTSMFEGCSALKRIYCKEGTDWADKTPDVSSSENMFKDCSSLTKTEGTIANDINNAHEPLAESDYAAYFWYKSPLHDNLYEYTPKELKVTSDYLAKYYTEESTDPFCVKFRSFRDNGLTIDGSDNGVDMKTNPNKINHWAIDANNHIASDPDFEMGCDANTTIQARIIGIREDKGTDGKPIGLTFMTTHALQSKSAYETDGPASYGWSGDSTSGSCTLRTFLFDFGDTLFPSSLKSVVKTAQKSYKYSSTLGSGTANDKFWAPSMFEMYGKSSNGDWPNDNEGSQYKAFLNKVSESSYSPLANIDLYQSGSDRTNHVWSRSLNSGNRLRACDVSGYFGGCPDSGGVHPDYGVVSCFCIGTETEPPFPSHENLYEYTPEELRVVSDYLTKNYSEESQDPNCIKFRTFRDSGLTTDGSDNGVAMKADFTSHWAIDKNGKLFGEAGFINDNTTIQARIIGICEDKDTDGKPIGLTFMTTHALQSKSVYETDGTAKYGWSGDSTSGSCTLRTFLSDSEDTLFPWSLKRVVKRAQKSYKYSSTLGSGTANDKFWAPSMFEMYGKSSDERWPKDNEGSQYKAFLNKKVSESSYKPLANIDRYQFGIDRTTYVRSRSLYNGEDWRVCDVCGSGGGMPGYVSLLNYDFGVVSCFCI